MKKPVVLFNYVQRPEWPPLAWLAVCRDGRVEVIVHHGPGVETNRDWFCEAIWDASYANGDFDQTDIVAGTGARLRGTGVVFVSSGSTVDRLNYFRLESDQAWMISNSLVCLLNACNADGLPTYGKYYEDFRSIVRGLRSYVRQICTTAGPAELVYFDNLVWNARSLLLQPKPNPGRPWRCFSDYAGFLKQTMSRVAENLSDRERASPYRMLGTLSSGYDSTAVCTLAAQAGCKEALCFDKGRGDEPDSGEGSAKILGMHAYNVPTDSWRSIASPEIPFLAGNAMGEEVRFRAAEELLARRVLLTGFHGDKVWDKFAKDLTADIVRGDPSGGSLTEYRLWKHFIHCPIPFWGVRQIQIINTISKSTEMSPWDVGDHYSRPICRRLAEEAGIPRETFGIRKRAASSILQDHEEFLTPASIEDYLDWLKENRHAWLAERRVPPALLPRISLTLDRFLVDALDRAVPRLKARRGLWRLGARIEYHRTRLRRYLFPWALERAKGRYGAIDRNL